MILPWKKEKSNFNDLKLKSEKKRESILFVFFLYLGGLILTLNYVNIIYGTPYDSIPMLGALSMIIGMIYSMEWTESVVLLSERKEKTEV